jgi:chromosome partitioning protein
MRHLVPDQFAEPIMRGRRRRNKALRLDEQRAASDPDSGAVGGGAVKLVETRSPGEAEPDDVPPSDPATPPPMHETISDVATAHAHLDSVLSPEAPESGSEVTDEHIMNVDDQSAAAPEPLSNIEPPVSGESQTSVVEVDPSPPMEDTSPPMDDTAAEVPGQAETEVVEEPATGAKADSVPEGQSAASNPLPRVMAVANQKGGVGKTTTSVNLGAALAELGFRVLVIDLDPQGNATSGLGIDARNFELSMYDVMMRDASMDDCIEPTSMKNLFVAPATIALAGAEIELVPAFSRELKLKRSIESVIDDFDYLLIDCPPSLGLITVNALAAADEVLVPIQCEYYALEGLSQLMRNVHLVASNLNPKLDISTIVLTMYDARTKLADQVAEEVRQHFGRKVCRSVIPRTVRLSEAPSFGQPITTFDPASRGAIAYRELAKEVSGGTT